MKTLVTYYSKTGSNRYLAEKIANRLQADLEPIRPRGNVFFLQLLFSLMGLGLGIRPFRRNMKDYDQLVVCGPIWMGQFLYPIRACMGKYRRHMQQIHFATCCGSTDEMKNDKFGYGLVFEKARAKVGNKLVHCEAFPIVLVIPEEQREDDETIMNTRLSDENFQGEIQTRLDQFVARVADPVWAGVG
jgi:hypothetical protein